MIRLPDVNIATAKPAPHAGRARKAQASPPRADKTNVEKRGWRLIICGAKTRAGHPCRMPPVKGKTRCRMHGGKTAESKSAGAPKGNTNAFVHGYYSAEARAERKRLADQLRWLKKEMKELRKVKRL